MQYLISTANAVSSDLDRLEEFFQELSLYLTRLKVWENELPQIAELEEVMTEVFTSVLVLCGICTKYVRMRRLVKAFRALAGEDDELKSAFNQFCKTIQREQGIVRNSILAGVQHLKLEARAVHKDVEETLVLTQTINRKTDDIILGTNVTNRYLETQENTLQRNNILSWLSSLDFHKKQRDIHSRRCDGTGSWFLNAEKFQQWLNSTHSSTLWCSGIPGAGKSVMTSVAIKHIEEHTERRHVAIAYVYCDYTDPKLQSEIELICSITRQLVEKIHPIPEEVKTYRDRWAEKKSYPNQNERVSLIKEVASHFTRTYIFFDALDECPEQNRTEFLRMLQMLEPFVHLFITSRPHLELHSTLPNLSRIEIAASDYDIQVYLASEISKNERTSLFIAKDTTLKAQIIDTINRKAEGMFLLAHFQVAYICRMTSPKKVRQCLNSLPTEIYDFYEKAVARIDSYSEEDKQLVKEALTYIYCARRPLILEELRHALGIETGDTEIDESALPETKILLNISVGLIRVDEKSNVVALVHHTLQEYLAKSPSKLLHRPESELAKTCLTYLSMDVFEGGPCTEGKALEQRLQDYPLLNYASHFWGFHLVAEDLHEWMQLFLGFISNKKKVASCLQVLHVPRHRGSGWFDCFPSQFTPLHIAAYFGLHWALKLHPIRDVNINSQDSQGTSALHLAAERGHLDVVQLLLEKDVNLDTRNSESDTPVNRAIKFGNIKIAELLLLNGANVLIGDSNGFTVLDVSVARGFIELTKLLLDLLYHVNFGYNSTNKALVIAAHAGTEETVRLFLDFGADVDWKDHNGMTALQHAVIEGHENVVRVLVETGANINSRVDVYGNSLLHYSLPYISMVEFLLEKGAQINAKNGHGKTPLIWSAHGGQVSVLQLLVNSGADVTAQDLYGSTALHIAAMRGHEAIVSVLLENGAEPDRLDRDDWTPLHAAALKKHEVIVHLLKKRTNNGENILKWVESRQTDARKQAFLADTAYAKSIFDYKVTGLRSPASAGRVGAVQELLEAGAEVDAVDASGDTALIVAVVSGQERVVQILLTYGAAIDKPTTNGNSALHTAITLGQDGIARLLVENGADVNACNNTWTPLLIAALKGNERAVEYLVRNRANVCAEDYYGRTALHLFAQHGHHTIMRLLTKQGADIHAKDQCKRTPLRYAVTWGKLAAAKFLLENGADIEAQTRDACTAVHVASYYGDKNMVSLLLQRGARIEARTRKGFKPLHIAALFGYEDVTRLLLENDGKDLNDDEITTERLTDEGASGDDDILGGEDIRSVDDHMYERLVQGGKLVDSPRSWTVRKLAVMSGNKAVQGLLAPSNTTPFI